MAWMIHGGSAPGSKHQFQPEQNQDAIGFRLLGPYCLGVLADGAGSAKLGGQGAQLAVSASLPLLEALINQDQFENCPAPDVWLAHAQEIVDRLGQQLALVASLNQHLVTDLACTLLVFLATPDWLAGFQIGDSHLVWRQQDQVVYQLACPPDRGEYANETTFLTSSGAKERLKSWVLPGPVGFVAAASDGIEPVSLMQRDFEPYPGFYQVLDRWLDVQDDVNQQQLETFLTSERLNQRTSDDRSLILAGWREP